MPLLIPILVCALLGNDRPSEANADSREVRPYSAIGSLPSADEMARVFNGTFDEDHGPFIVPLGWTPYGEASYSGHWDQEWHVQISNLPAEHHAGLYQVVPHTRRGKRYRLTAKVKCGHAHLAARLAVLPRRSDGPLPIVWSDPHSANEWKELALEFQAHDEAVVVYLDLANSNREWQLLEAGEFEDVTLEILPDAPDDTMRAVFRPDTSYTTGNVIEEMANLWSLAWPKPGVRTVLAGTHHPDPGNNQDFNRVEGHTEIKGETWTILKSWEGPGALTRIWMTNFRHEGVLRIELDGEAIYTGKLRAFFGEPGPFTKPLNAKTTGAYLSQYPMPFRASCRLLVQEAESDRFYWQANVQKYDAAEGVETLNIPENTAQYHRLGTIMSQWTYATIDPKPTREDAAYVRKAGTVDLEAGGSQVIWTHDGPASIGRLFVEPGVASRATLQGLRIRATWDGVKQPQVDAPLGLFFGVGYERTICRGLLMGMAPGVGGYCYFPMPMQSGGRIELINTTGEAVRGIRYSVHHIPEKDDAVSPLRFHAITVQDDQAGKGELFVPVEVEGRGHFVGLSAAMQYGSDKNAHFLEGDEYVWVDGEESPSHMGTGTEDYFSCGWYFFAGPLTLPVIGAPIVKQDPEYRVSAYRLHVGDWIPFARSFKLGFEVGDSVQAEEYGRYTTVSYVYLGKAE